MVATLGWVFLVLPPVFPKRESFGDRACQSRVLWAGETGGNFGKPAMMDTSKGVGGKRASELLSPPRKRAGTGGKRG